jgi:hypothetical protein
MSATLSLAGLRPDQIERLTATRDDLFGWEHVGCAVTTDNDDCYFWSNNDRASDIEAASIYVSRAEAEREIIETIRPALGLADDERELTVVGVYRKGDEYDTGPADPQPLGEGANAYQIDTNDFVSAIAQLVTAYRKENGGMDFKCTCWDGTRVSITSGKPPKPRKGKK